MPSLVMRAPAGSLLEQTNRLVVRRQMKYGAELGVPWGISESAYNARDLELTYQYSNFGVPGLGLKRGLSENAVIAPYATALAAMVDPEAAAQNFSRLAAAGGLGRFGWYEALDYTPSRVPEGETVAIVRAYMAHHQGMTLVAIANALHDGAMRARFHAEPIIQATELLLQERTPRDVAVARPRAEEVKAAANVRELAPPTIRRFHSPHDPIPRTHLLSNGRYTVMITAAGSGYSRWRDLAVTRWREDVTCDSWGTYIFLRDVHSGKVWSAGLPADRRRAGQLRSRVLGGSRRDRPARRHDHDDARSGGLARGRRRGSPRVDLQSRQPRARDRADLVRGNRAGARRGRRRASGLLQAVRADGVRRRRRRAAGHAAARARRPTRRSGRRISRWSKASRSATLQFETDRARFLGRGRGIRTPVSVIDGRPLSNTVGTVLDPIFSLRRRVRIPAGRHGARRVLDAGRAVARRSARSGRQASRPDRLRARGDARLDPGAGAAPSSRHRRRRGASVPASRQSRALFRSDAAAFVRRAAARRGRTIDALGRTESPAICRSCWFESTRPRIWRSSASCCAPTSIGG